MPTFYPVQIELGYLPKVGNKKLRFLRYIGGFQLALFRRKDDGSTRHSKTCNKAIHPHSPAKYVREVNSFF